MNKLKKVLPFLLAVVIIAFGYLGIELSQAFLPDYKNTFEKLGNTKSLSLLYFDNTANIELYPMNLYDSSKTKKVEYKKINKLVLALMNNLCPTLKVKDNIDYSGYLECMSDEGAQLFFIKDLKLTAADTKTEREREYTLNLAFTKVDVLYFSCVPEYSEPVTSKRIEKAYTKLDEDHKRYAGINPSGDSEIESRYIESDGTKTNDFILFVEPLDKLDAALDELGMNHLYTTVENLILYSRSTGMSYNEMMYVSFSSNAYQLIMIYDPNSMAFVGFSLSDRS